MAPDLSRKDPAQEGNLLIEAVSLLVQRQRETESWVAEQLWQAEERAAATERRYAELEARLAELEDQLVRLANDVEPGRGDSAADERLARLREQLEGLKLGVDGRQTRASASRPSTPTEPAASREVESTRPLPAREAVVSARESEATRVVAAPEARFERRAVSAPSRRAGPVRAQQDVGFWELLGNTPQDRASVILMGLGGVLVLYVLLSQVRFG